MRSSDWSIPRYMVALNCVYQALAELTRDHQHLADYATTLSLSLEYGANESITRAEIDNALKVSPIHAILNYRLSEAD